MKFYFSKDTSTVNSRFVIYDELGHVKCYVLRDYSHSYWNLVITDISFNKLCTIYSVPLPFMKAFTIKNNNSTIRLVFNKNKFRPMCYYYGISWRICGDILGKNFEIRDTDNSVLLTHYKKWADLSKGYEINITDNGREIFLLASVVCVHLIETNEKKQLVKV